MLPRVYDGSGQPAQERLTLQAGKLTLDYEAGMLRYIRLGEHEIVRGIYATVRDHNWGTIPAVLRDVTIDTRADSFRITFTSDHQQGDLHFVWRGMINGTADSAVTFSFQGEARTSFKRNRIGFCVLHPMEAAGKPLEIEHTNGTLEQGQFPLLIAPHQPYFDLRALTYEVADGIRAEVRMEGDTFEMEDQRNWTDASFKTYCTPLALPFPAVLAAETKVSQSISVRVIGGVSKVEMGSSASTLHLDTTISKPIPAIGLCAAPDRLELDNREFQRLAKVISHLRVDLDLDAHLEQRLNPLLNAAWSSRWSLELAVHVGQDREGELQYLREVLEKHAVHGCLLLFRKGSFALALDLVEVAQRVFTGYPQALELWAGTDAYFTQLNRNQPPSITPSTLAYSVTPQVHAFDNSSLIETLAALGATVQTARRFAPDAKIAVTPITLKIRTNPDATAPEAPTPPGQLPRRVDPRQMSLFGAGWTMGAIESLALAGADSLTFFETTGWLGVMERSSGSPLSDLFPSIPGGVFPMYHIFADVGDFAGGQVMRFASSHPLRFSGLALRSESRRRLLVANHTQERQTVTITGIGGTWTLKSLDEHTAIHAMRDPEGYRAAPGQPVIAGDRGLQIDLLPYAVVRLDQSS